MSPKLGIAIVVACCLAAVGAGYSKNNGTSSTPTPAPVGSVGPDTVYVQDTGSKTIRA